MLRERLHAAGAGRMAAVAISREETAWTFAELGQRIDTLATRLTPTMQSSTLAAALPGGPEFTALQFACTAADVLFAPLPPIATTRELRAILDLLRDSRVVVLDADTAARYQQAGARTILFDEFLRGEPLPSLRDGRDFRVDHDDPRVAAACLLQLTSGTTGRPTGVLLTEANLIANLDQNLDFLATFADRPIFCPLPQHQAMGGAVALEHLCVGSPVHFANRFDPAADARRMAATECAGLWANPHFVRLAVRLGLLREDRLPTLAEVTLGTAPVSAELVRDLQKALPHAAIHVRYGLAEASGTLAQLTLQPGESLPARGAVGTAVANVEFRTDRGLLARAPNCAEFGLGADGEAFALLDDDGFLATGDLAALQASGSVQLRGRLDLALNVHGHRVDPGEIETLLCELADVGEAVVLGVPHADDERVVACLEPLPGRTVPDTSRLQAACDVGLSPHKRPSRFVTMEQLPRTPMGKPDRQALAESLRTQTETRG